MLAAKLKQHITNFDINKSSKMDINFALQNIFSINDYMAATHNIRNKNIIPSINIATVIALKKIRSLEIEYLSKYDENGAACIVFERLLTLPPSNIWGVLAVEFVNLIKYWLDNLKKHLTHHYGRWWMFLKMILKFIKEIRRKHSSFPNKLVDLLSDSLLHLATTPKTDVYQRHEILHCLNVVSAESDRELRFAMRSNFGDYFANVASDMLAASFFPFQYSALECLVRWLVPREEPALRVAAADKWLPTHLCPETARNMFLELDWLNFLKDGRCFLNEINRANGQTTSFVCKQLSVGKLDLIVATDRRPCWVDLDTPGKSVSVILDTRALVALGLVGSRAYEALVIDDNITDYVLLRRETLGLSISLKLLRAPYIRPTDIKIEGQDHQVTIVVSSRSDLRILNRAMTNIFEDKYRPLFDLDSDVSCSPEDKIKNYNTNSEEDTRFSQPAEVKCRNRCGYAVKTNKQAGRLTSQSSVSTSSLTQLRVKLTALPQFHFNKGNVSVCAQPALSHVSEVTEKDDQSISSATTVKFQRYGVRSSYKSLFYQKKTQEQKSRSDSETVTHKSKGGKRVLSPVVSEDNNASLLLVSTLGSNDSVINETIEKISKSNHFKGNNIVDLLIQQAFQAKPKSIEVSDSGINTDDKKSQEDSEAIDNTPNEVKGTRSKVPLSKNCTVISKSTTDDESNTEAINETPFIYSRMNNLTRNKPRIAAESEIKPIAKTVEKLFSQHIDEVNRGEKLESSLNENNSDLITYFDEIKSKDINKNVERDVYDKITHLSSMGDVLDKIGSYEQPKIDPNVIPGSNKTVQGEDTDIFKDKNVSKPMPLEVQRSNIKQKPAKKTKARVTKKTKNVKQKKNTKKMSTIVEQKEEDAFRENIYPETDNNVVIIRSPDKINETTPSNKKETPSLRRKRKLYSPKDEEMQVYTVEKTSSDSYVPLSELKTINNPKTPKNSAACYKELERERKKYTHATRSRRTNSKVIEMSPRTRKMNTMFDNLRQTVESNENITLADKNTDVFNFTSSDDEHFETKKIVLKSRTIESNKARKTRDSQRTKESESSYEDAKTVRNMKLKRKLTNKQKPDVTVPVVKLVDAKINLIDEKIRESVRAEPNTSILIERAKDLEPEDEEPEILPRDISPEIEQMQDSEANDGLISIKNAKKIIKKKYSKSKDTSLSKTKVNKRVEKKDKIIPDFRDDSSSPLPGLLVEESMPNYKDDINDSLSTTLLQKFKKIYQECPNDTIDPTTQSSTPNSIKLKSPVVSIAKISLEEFNKWLPIPKTNKNRDDDKPDKATGPAVKLVDKRINLIDERMRGAVRERSNASIFIENPIDTESEDIEPMLEESPQMERIKDIESNDILQKNAQTTPISLNLGSESNDSSVSTVKVNKSAEKAEILVAAKEKVLDKNDKKNMTSGSEDDSSSRQITTPESIKSKSPTVSIAKMSFEEFNKWLPIPKHSEATEDKTIRKSRSRSKLTNIRPKLTNKDESVHEIIGCDTDESGTTKIPYKHKTRETKVHSVDSTSILKISPVKLFECSASNLESNSSDNGERSTGTKKYSFRSTTKCMKSVESMRQETPKRCTKRKSLSPILSASKKRRSDHPSYRDAVNKILEYMDTTLGENNDNTIEKFLSILTEALEDQKKKNEEQLKSYKQLSAAATELQRGIKVINDGLEIFKSGIAVLNVNFADFYKTLRENVANLEISKASDAEMKETLLEQVPATVRADCLKQRAAIAQYLKRNLQDIIDYINRNRRTDSS